MASSASQSPAIIPARGNAPAVNLFNSIPVEVIRMIATSNWDPEGVASLSLCNQDLQIIVHDLVELGATAYVAVCSLDRDRVLMTLRKRGRKELISGLVREVENIFALDIVAQKNSVELFNIVQPYITHGDPGTLEAYKSAVSFRHKGLAERMSPFLSEDSILNALDFACLTGTATIVSSLLLRIPLNKRAIACTSKVEFAVTTGRTDLLRVLIQGGAELDFIISNEADDGDRRTILHWLAMWGLWANENQRAVGPMVTMVCHAGADVNAKDYRGRTPLHEFAGGGSKAASRDLMFEDDFTNERPDWVYECALRDLIKAGADINAQDEFGLTPLHLAVKSGECVMINILMEMGVNALITDKNGKRASSVNFPRMAPHTIDFQVWKYELAQEAQCGNDRSAVL